MTFRKPSTRIENKGTKFSGSCGELGKMLKRQHPERDHSARQLSDVAENVVSETYRLFRTGTRVELLKVAEVIEEIPINLSKTMGCNIERGADVPLISSISGWGSSAIYLGKVLDSSA